jgi:hypothetical protein
MAWLAWLLCLFAACGGSPTEPAQEIGDAEQCVRWESRNGMAVCVEWR